MVFLLLTYMTLSIYGQNTSLNNYGADNSDTNKDTEPNIRDTNICAEYKQGCDPVPQNVPIPFDMIPFEDNKDVVTEAKIYT